MILALTHGLFGLLQKTCLVSDRIHDVSMQLSLNLADTFIKAKAKLLANLYADMLMIQGLIASLH